MAAAAYLNDRVYLLGGQAQHQMNDFRLYNPATREWTCISSDGTLPVCPRFSHTISVFKNQLVIFGGAGQYLKKLKKRETFNDVWLHKPSAPQDFPKPARKSIIKQSAPKEPVQER